MADLYLTTILSGETQMFLHQKPNNSGKHAVNIFQQRTNTDALRLRNVILLLRSLLTQLHNSIHWQTHTFTSEPKQGRRLHLWPSDGCKSRHTQKKGRWEKWAPCVYVVLVACYVSEAVPVCLCVRPANRIHGRGGRSAETPHCVSHGTPDFLQVSVPSMSKCVWMFQTRT